MRIHFDRLMFGVGLALLSPAAFAVELEAVQASVGLVVFYFFVLFTVLGAALVCCTHLGDKRAAPLEALCNGDAIQSVEPEALVTDCVRKMTDKKIGGLMVMNGEKLIGIFTERDALSKVLAAGRDPRTTQVSEVMTKNPYCVSPKTTVGAAMDLVAERHFRHLPIVENGTVLAVLSSRDLTNWLVKGRLFGDVQKLVHLAALS